MRTRVLVLLTLAALAAAPAAVAAPDEPIRLGRSIGLVAVGETARSVQRDLGAGRVVARRGSPFGSTVVRAYPARGLRVTFTGGTVTYVQARFARYRTARGVRVGSTLAALRRAHPRVVRIAPGLWLLGRPLPGARVTDFRLRRDGRVGEVGVGIVLD